MEALVNPLEMTEKLPGVVDKFWRDLWEGKRNGKLVAWCSGGGPFEMLKAMDILVVWPEGYGGICAAAGIGTELCQRAENFGLSPDLCSVIRTFIGSVDGSPPVDPETLPNRGLPRPDLLVCQTYCPGIYRTWQRWSRHYNIPLLVMEKVRWHDRLSREEIALYERECIEELEDIADFLGKFTQRPFDYERLSEMLALEREAARLYWDILGLCRNVPAPMSIFDAFSHYQPFYLHRATQEAVDYYRKLKAELQGRIANKTGALVGEEKYRLYWDGNPIFFKLKEHIRKFASYGAVPVVSNAAFYFGYFPDEDRANPLETLFEMLFFKLTNRGLRGRIDFITKQVRDYSLDGLIMQRARTCLFTNMGQEDIAEALVEKTGLPAVAVEGDMADARFYSSAEFDKKIDGFMEVLEQRRRNGPQTPASAGPNQFM